MSSSRYFKVTAPGIVRIKDLAKRFRFDEVFSLSEEEIQKSNNLKTFIVAGFISEVKQSDVSQERISMSSDEKINSVQEKVIDKKLSSNVLTESEDLKNKINMVKEKALQHKVDIKIKETRKEDYMDELRKLKDFKGLHPELFEDKSIPLTDQLKIMNNHLVVTENITEKIGTLLPDPSETTTKDKDIDSFFEDEKPQIKDDEKSFRDLMSDEDTKSEAPKIETPQEVISFNKEEWKSMNWKKKIKLLSKKTFSNDELKWIVENDTVTVSKKAQELLS